MIRDPSDGSVREMTTEEDRLVRKALFDSGKTMEVLSPSTSGLPITKAKADYLERLARSHEWLKDYHAMRAAKAAAPASEAAE